MCACVYESSKASAYSFGLATNPRAYPLNLTETRKYFGTRGFGSGRVAELKGLDKKLCSMLCQKGPDLLMLCSANLQDRAVFAMCSLKVSWSSKISPRCLTELDGIIVVE